MTKDKLLVECLKVRKALENAAKCYLVSDQMFYLFPHGACLTSKIVLAQYLLRFDDKNEFFSSLRLMDQYILLPTENFIRSSSMSVK